MIFLFRAFSLSYLRRHRTTIVLTVIGVMAGVATFASIREARHALVAGLTTTVDRVAGQAQLQVGGIGGVPESLQDRVREVRGVRAVAPIIEEVVDTEPPGLGSVLLLGVDLLGDRGMREYGFEGEDADLDDPLLFLAQPDSVAVSGDFARRAGLAKDSVLTLRLGSERKRLVVRAVLQTRGFGSAFGGAVVVTDVYSAQQILGRGLRFDRLDIRLEPDLSADDGENRLRAAIGPGYRIETPERRGAQMERLISTFTAGFDVSSILALGIGVFLIFNTFTVSVHRRRREIGTLRGLGATPRQVQGLVLVEALVLGAAGGLGGVLFGGVVAGGFLDVMKEAVDTGYGLTPSATTSVDASLVLQSIGLGILASVLGAWIPARAASRVHPVEAFATGVFAARVDAMPVWKRTASVGCAALAIGLAWRPPVTGTVLIALVLFSAGLAVTMLAGPAGQAVLSAMTTPLRRLAPASGRLALDSLQSHPRRTAITTATITLSLAFALGLGGYLRSVESAFSSWVEDVMTADLYVRAAAGFAPSAGRLPWDLADRLRGVPGVRSVDGFRNDRLLRDGDEITLVAFDAKGMLERTHQELTGGTPETVRRGLVEEGGCVISDNLSRRLGLQVGDTLTVEAPAGQVRLPIAGVVTSFLSEHGTIMLDRSVFVRHWNDDRVDMFHVSVEPGADIANVRNEIRSRLAGRYPALISTRTEVRGELQRALAGFYTLTRLTIVVALAVAFVGVAAALFVSVVDRTREIGILMALGAMGWQIRSSVVLEALVVSGASLVLALPVGGLLARFLTTTVAEAYAGYRLEAAYPIALLAQLLVMLPIVAALASWLPARHAAAIHPPEAIAYE